MQQTQTKTGLTLFSDRIVAVEKVINTGMFFIMLMIMFLQVLMRYVFHYPLIWSEELIRYLFIVSTYLGSAIAVHHSAHIEINIWPPILDKIKDEKTKEVLEKRISIIADFICLIFIIMFCWLVFVLVQRTSISGQVSPALNIPMSIIFGGMLVSAVLMAFHYIVNVITKLRLTQ